jgi:hypothetical protein
VSRRPGATLIALYPVEWRARYGEELGWLLEASGLGLLGRLDLLRGAVDAHLHPRSPSPLPVVATLTGGALAVAHATVIGAQPVPPDWPGYIEDALPLAMLAVVAFLPAIIGLWLKLGDGDGILGRLGIVIAIAGHLAWLAALAVAELRIEYGAPTAVTATVAMAGLALLGVALAGGGAPVPGVLLVTAALAGVAPPDLGWPVFGIAWSALGFVLLVDFHRRADSSGGPLGAG